MHPTAIIIILAVTLQRLSKAAYMPPSASVAQPVSVAPPPPASLTTAGKCSCGQRNNQGTRITGGESAKANEFPWRVALYVSSLSDGFSSFVCTASLIDSSWVLTAAHCVNGRQASQVHIFAGKHDLGTVTKNDAKPVSQIIFHPNQDGAMFENDLALLRLETPYVYSKNISPVCLPFLDTGKSFANERATASGWGMTVSGVKDPAKVLQKLDLDILSNEDCRKIRGRRTVEIITDYKLCTFEKGKGVCKGDSGGSLDYYNPSRKAHYAIGVAVFGSECDGPNLNVTGGWARVTKYLDWIQQSTGAPFCKPQ